MKIFKRLTFLFLTALTLFVAISLPINVFASENSYSNYAATYKVVKVKEEYDLGYGVQYHMDQATTSVVDTQYANGHGSNNELKYTVQPNKEYEQIVNVLEIDSTKGAMLVPYAYLSGSTWSATSLRSVALDFEVKNPGYRVVAGVNGDYFHINDPVKASTGVTIGQGEYYKSINNHSGANTIAIKNDGNGKQLFTVSNTQNAPVLSIYDANGNIIKKYSIAKVNQEPTNDEIAVFYTDRQKAFQNTFLEGTEFENAWLVDKASRAVTTQKNSFYGIGNITEKVQAKRKIESGQFAIKTNNAEVNDLLSVGVKIRVQYEFTDPSLSGVDNFIGFPFKIIENNEILNHDAYRHPRTMIGQKANGEIVLAVIDGRQEQSLALHGASSTEMAALMGYYGCVDAWNLDGGGSSTLIIRKQPGWDFEGFNEKEQDDWHVTNSPSDGSERSDGNHLLVVVKVPEVSIELEDAEVDQITIKVALLTEIEKYKDLYINLNGKYFQVVDGKVTITGLKKNTQYSFTVSSKVDDTMYNLMYTAKYYTSKPIPTTVSIRLEDYVAGGKHSVLVKYTFDNKDAIKTIKLIADESYLSARDLIIIDQSMDFYTALINAIISVKYLENPDFEDVDVEFTDFEVTVTAGFAMEEMDYSMDSFIKDLFE